MRTLNKRELQQSAFNHSSEIDFRYFTNLYKTRSSKPYSLLVIDTTVSSDNPLNLYKIFSCNLLLYNDLNYYMTYQMSN